MNNWVLYYYTNCKNPFAEVAESLPIYRKVIEYKPEYEEVFNEIKRQVYEMKKQFFEPKKVIIGLQEYLKLVAHYNWLRGSYFGLVRPKEIMGLEIILAGQTGIQVICDFDQEFTRQLQIEREGAAHE